MPITTTYPDWIWQGTINYLYWTTADQNGNFTIPNVDPNVYSPSTPAYTLYCYVPGIFASGTNPTGSVVGPGFVSNGSGGYISSNGEYVQNNVTVAASGTTNLGTISWNPPRAQNLLFQVGIPDRSTADFRFGDLIKQFGLWWRYYNELGTSDLNFNVGTSNSATDWYYAQPIFALPNGTYCFPHWNINFNLSSVPASPVTLTMNLAGGYGTYFYIYVNGVNVTPGSYNYAGIPTNSGADIYRDVVQIGQFQQYLLTLPSSAFKTGSNNLQIQLRQPGFKGSWNTSGYYPDLVAGGLMYDAIKLESGPLTNQMIQNGTYKLGSGLNGFVARVQNGSTTSGAPVVEYPFEFIPDEEWTINDLGNDVYSIVAVNSGMALTVQNASKSVNAPIVQSPYTGAASQQWQAQVNTSGGLSFINVNSGLALDITGQRSDYQNNVQLIQNTPGNSLSQSWYQSPQTYGPPPAVTDLSATSGNGQVSLAWSPTERATGYTIMRGITSGSETTLVAANISGTTYTDTALTNGTNYDYVVVATINPGGSSPNSNEASVTPLPPLPAAPANLVALPGNGLATLSWSPSTYATSYTLSRTPAGGGATTVVASGLTVTSATDTGLVNGHTYDYTVAALGLSGTGANSNIASVTPTQYKPGPPTGLAALSGNNCISLTWSAPSGAGPSSYILERGTSSGVYNVQYTIPAQYVSYLDTSVTNGNVYYYAVGASNPNGTSVVSNQVSATPAAVTPAVPTGLAATGGNQQVALSWKASTGATGYTLVRGTSSGIYPVVVLSNAAVTSCTDTGLSNGTVYYYAVSALSLGGTSGNSTQASATPSRSAGAVIWTGNTNIVWDLATPNWQFAGTNAAFQNGDSTSFGDGANANNVAIFLTSTVSPGSITVNTSALNYSLAGVGSITGTTGLSFNGNGSTTFSIGVGNNFTGKTTIQNGTLAFYTPGNLGTGSVALTSGTINAGSYGGGTLQMGNNPISMSGVTNAVIMAPAMNLGPVIGSGTMNITATDATGATKADNLTGSWGGNFTGVLNFSSTVTGGSLLSAYYNGGTPNFDGNLSKATVNFSNVGICSIDASAGNTVTFGALNGDSKSSIIGSAYAGGMTVNIGGLNTNSVFAGSITDSTNGSGNTKLIKSGAGSLTLGGSCAYTGATSVTQGNLTVNGMLAGAGTALTVSSGASLGGTGSVIGAVTVNSGGGLVLSATGNLSVSGTVAFGGTVTVTSGTSPVLASGTYTLLSYSGTLTGTPAFNYVPPKGVNQSATFNTSVPGVITVNVSGPPAAPTGLVLTPGNGQVGLEWNAPSGASGYIIERGTSSGGEVAITGGTTASTSYTDTAVTNGLTYYYTVTATNSFGTGGTSVEQSAMPVQTFNQWIAASFPGVTNTNIIAMSAIPENDGVANLLKYFMGLNPAKHGALPISSALDGQGNLVLTFPMSKNLTGVSCSVDESSDLKAWTSTGLQGSILADKGSAVLMDVAVPLPASGPLFLRLSVSSP
jgi:autotransporter-associated beta strand protein